MIQESIRVQSETILKKYLAPEVATKIAAEIADATAEEVASSVTAALVGATTKRPSVMVKRIRKPQGPAVKLTPDSRVKMSFRKTVQHAERRAARHAPPKPYDAEVLAANARGEILDVRAIKARVLTAPTASITEMKARPRVIRRPATHVSPMAPL